MISWTERFEIRPSPGIGDRRRLRPGDYRGGVVQHATLEMADFDEATFGTGDFYHATFDEADFRWAEFGTARFYGATFSGGYFNETSYDEAVSSGWRPSDAISLT